MICLRRLRTREGLSLIHIYAACYAVVAYQTAYLKYYYPVEFMAALMTSVIDNPGKVAEYILTCRQMGISIPVSYTHLDVYKRQRMDRG